MTRKHIANSISIARVALLAPVIICSHSNNEAIRWIGWSVLLMSFLLDAVDGYCARRYGSVSFVGSFLDIFADRLTEIILFATIIITTGTLLVPRVVLILFFGRILLVDACRILAFVFGEITPTGPKLSGAWRYLNLSSLSRGGYATYKALYFSILMFFPSAVVGIAFWRINLTTLLSVTLVAFSTLRGLPILQLIIHRFFCHEKQPSAPIAVTRASVAPNLILFLLDVTAMFAVFLR